MPARNLLGEAGKGHHIAFNVLNIGRFKLGVACIGGARHALAHMIRYAKERQAFGKAIAEFGLIQKKISTGGCAAVCGGKHGLPVGGDDRRGTCAGERRGGGTRRARRRREIEEYAVECSILKVYGSEMLDAVWG